MKVFVAGPRSVNSLSKSITDVLSRMVEKQLTILLGDAAGVDRLVQEYFADARYPNVYIYASDGKVRNNLCNWPIQKVEVPAKSRGFNFYVQKDIKMAQDADNGFMIWNGKSKGTLNNIINLASQNKKVKIYLIPLKKILCVDKPENVKKIVQLLGPEPLSLYNELYSNASNSESVEKNYHQLTLSEFL